MNNISDYYQIHKMTDCITPEFPIISNEKDALKYLYFLDKTNLNASSVYNIIDYELLIYLEFFFSENKEIQSLLKNIKEKVYHDFILKHKYIKRLTDDLCKNNIVHFPYEFTNYYYDDLGLTREEIINEKI